MTINIVSKKGNILLARKDIEAVVDYTGPTPKKEEVRKLLASKIGSEENLVIVNNIKTSYGDRKAKVYAVVYNSEADLLKLNKPKVKKDAKPEEKKEEKK